MPLLSLQDFDLHYEIAGSGPPVLLVHGLGSSGADWAFQVEQLSTSFQLICPDLRGSGLSGKPPGPYRIGQFAADLWQLIDELGLESCYLAGFSLGGAVALEMALQQPERAERLVMINALPTYRIDHWRKWMQAQLQLNLVRWLGLPHTARVIAKRIFPHGFQAPMRRRVEQVVGQNAKGPYLATLRALMDWCAADRLHEISNPTLFLSAEFDYTPAEEKRAFAEVIGAEFLLVKGSRHGTPFDAITATNRVLEAFFGQQPLPTDLSADDEAAFSVNTEQVTHVHD
ncbi:MAG: alpha/beta hydrolase [Pseudomonadota bacterium]